MKSIWFFISAILFCGAYFPFSIGLRKLQYTGSKIQDAFVGGDAYNFIINSEQSIAYFTIAAILVFSAFGCVIAGYLHGIYESMKNVDTEGKEDVPKESEEVNHA